MGRNKSISDELVLDALLVAIVSSGPAELTFSRASAAVGLSAPALVQRFGNRDSMIEAALLHAWDRLDAATATAEAESPADPEGAISMLLRLMPPATADHDIADGLLLLREDFRNPVLRTRGAAWGAYLARSLGRRLTDKKALAERMGWQMASMWQGAIIWWAFKRGSDAQAEVRKMLRDWCRSVGVM